MSNSVSLIDGHIDTHHIDLWLEGYQCMEGSSTAVCLGTYDAGNLRDAVQQWVNEEPNERKQYVDLLRLTYWGCRFFDNEADARKTFG